jgi:hypothetical protein
VRSQPWVWLNTGLGQGARKTLPAVHGKCQIRWAPDISDAPVAKSEQVFHSQPRTRDIVDFDGAGFRRVSTAIDDEGKLVRPQLGKTGIVHP